MDQELGSKSLPLVNELLKTVSPAGAYCLGLVCALAWEKGIEPGQALLETAARCQSTELALDLYRMFGELRPAHGRFL